ncbi:MAG: UDP-N-acetylmuramate dehydrogenase [Bacteroidales bacterium]|nr:UDP-N-acetylmuramate dehydrogenase [Bacteroidales bacterium]
MVKTEYYKDLTKMNTFGMRVKARCFIEYDSVADLVDIEFEELARPVLHIGGGSNLLFTDDFKGTVLHSKIDFIEILDECHRDGVEKLNPSHSGEWAPPVHEATGGHGFSNHPYGASSENGRVLVSVGSGVVFDDFCEWAAKEGLWGVENLSYIPGEVGASAVQNIGAYGVEVKDVIHKVYCYDTVEEEFVHFDVEECGYGYRDSIFKRSEVKGRYIVTHVVFALSRAPQPKLEYGHLKDAVAEVASSSSDPRLRKLRHPLAGGGTSLPSDAASAGESGLTPEMIRKVIIKIRKEKLPEPSVKGSAGSFFKNPVVPMEQFLKIEAAAKAEQGSDYKVPHYDLPDGMVKIPAAWMIEQCGWKGKRSGGAAVWDKQPLVIVNHTGEAYPEEIIGLEKRIIASVRTRFGVELHPEVEHV